MSFWHNIDLSTRIVIIHPHYRQHRHLLSRLLHLDNVLYLRFDEASVYDMTWFQENIQPNILILDEFDRLEKSCVHDVLDSILHQYEQAQIILFSRCLPDLQAKHRVYASLFPIDKELGLVDYYKETRTVVEFFAFGTGAVAVNGKHITRWQEDTQIWLLFYLLEKGRVNRQNLLEVFWNGMIPKTAIKTLHNLKSRLNESLGVEAIIFQDRFYQLNPELEIVYDVANYRHLIEAAYQLPPNLSARYFAQAHDAYTGDYLQACNLPWVKTLRQSLLKTQADAQAHLGQIYAEQSQKEQALAWYSLAFKHNPVRDDVLLAMMGLFLDLEMPAYALSFFSRYAEILHEKHSIRPSKHFELIVEAAEAASKLAVTLQNQESLR